MWPVMLVVAARSIVGIWLAVHHVHSEVRVEARELFQLLSEAVLCTMPNAVVEMNGTVSTRQQAHHAACTAEE